MAMVVVNLPRNSKGLMIRAYESHSFPLIRPAIKPFFLLGRRLTIAMRDGEIW